MKLYHGTSEAVARKAVNNGLTPRSEHGASNWAHTSESHPDMIYLTSCYAPYYGQNAKQEGEKFGIIEVDGSKLNKKNFLPDEDFIWHNVSQHPKTKKQCQSWGKDMKEQVAYIRDHLHEYADWWQDCIERMGNVCYRGSIPENLITRVVVIDSSKAQQLCFDALNPTISPSNYLHLGKKYRMMQDWFMGYDVDVAEYSKASMFGGMPKGFEIPPEIAAMQKKSELALQKIMADKSAIEIIKSS